jgi:hypothetical protein
MTASNDCMTASLDVKYVVSPEAAGEMIRVSAR